MVGLVLWRVCGGLWAGYIIGRQVVGWSVGVLGWFPPLGSGLGVGESVGLS